MRSFFFCKPKVFKRFYALQHVLNREFFLKNMRLSERDPECIFLYMGLQRVLYIFKIVNGSTLRCECCNLN